MDQRCYRRNRPVHANLEKANKDSKTKEPKSKAQAPKPLGNFSKTTETSDKARKKKKKY